MSFTLDAATIFSIFVALLGSGGLAALVLLFPNIRKLRAEAKSVEVDTLNTPIEGAVLVTEASIKQMQAAIERAEKAEIRAEENGKALGRLERLVHKATQTEYAVVTWCDQAALQLFNAGIQVRPRPKLLLAESGGEVETEDEANQSA